MESMDLAIAILRSGMGYDDAASATGLDWRDIKAEWDSRVLRGGALRNPVNPFAEVEPSLDPRERVLSD